MTASATQQLRTPVSGDRWSLAFHGPVPRDTRRKLVAVATAGGGHVDGDFEEAEQFLLYEKTARRICYIGSQPCPRASCGGDPLRRTRLLADCDLVLCAAISEAGRETLSRLGIDCNLACAGLPVGAAVAGL